MPVARIGRAISECVEARTSRKESSWVSARGVVGLSLSFVDYNLSDACEFGSKGLSGAAVGGEYVRSPDLSHQK